MCDIPKGESGDVIASFNRYLTRRYPRVTFKGYDVACTWMDLLGFSELGVSLFKSYWCVGAFHKNAHILRYGRFVTCCEACVYWTDRQTDRQTDRDRERAIDAWA